MKKHLMFAIAFSLIAYSFVPALAQSASAQSSTEKLTIVSSIAPIHALLVELTKGVQKPRLLLSPKSMPHGARLTPSQARLLNQAQLLILVGSSFASFEKNIKQTEKRRVVRLTRLQGVKKIQYDGKNQHSEHEHEKHEGEKQEHSEHEEEELRATEGAIDPHLWLDPQNARVIVLHLAKVLGELDRANRKTYLQNAERIADNLQKLDQEIAESMSGLEGRFLVLHDATSYFVERYKIKRQENLYGAGHNATRDGMRHSLDVRKKLREGKYRCVFVQAQAPQAVRDRLVADQGQVAKTQVEKTQVEKTKVIEINPLSAKGGEVLQKDVDSYAGLLRSIAQAFRDCLG